MTVYDVAIIGGALMGSSTAYHLLMRDPSLKIAVVEKDPRYEFAASARSNSMVRVVFSQPENLLMSRYGQEFYNNFPDLMKIGDERPPLDYIKGGLLIIGNTEDQAHDIVINSEFQRSMGCDVDVLSPSDIKERWPTINTDDIVNGVLSPDAGWIDPHGALMGLRKKARDLGANYLDGEIVGFEKAGNSIDAGFMATGQKIEAKWFINTTGAWANQVCALLGFDIPVLPLPRMVFYFETQEPMDPLPYIRDGLGVGFRREGKGFISGITNFDVVGNFCFDVNHDWFEEHVWPGLANRVPDFERIKVMNAWVGHYAQCMLDGNMIIGSWPGQPENFLMATGFSGHGLQHAPAVGRALCELILDGDYQSIDLTRLTAQRVIDNAPYPERGWKA